MLPLFVLDPALWGPAGPVRRAYLAASLRALDASLRQRRPSLAVVRGDPVRRWSLAARAVGADAGARRRRLRPLRPPARPEVEQALADAGIELVRTGSPYAVAPGPGDQRLAATPYKVFTPFSKAWADARLARPRSTPRPARTGSALDDTTEIPDPELPDGLELPEAGEAAARGAGGAIPRRPGRDYDDDRDRPGVDGTSRMSVHLKWGEIHPRTMLADLAAAPREGAATYRKELAWREFYADVLFAPARDRAGVPAARSSRGWRTTSPARAARRLAARGGPASRSSTPGMRQLRATGWMHNRVRMIVASFLVKDLHLEWQHGARHFMHWLVDGDLASNQHGWQWTAGSGTDAAPFFRVFNPTSQGRKFDPDGAYVRRWVPELADAADPHEPDRGTPDGRLPGADRRPRRGAARGAGPWERIKR